MNPLNLYAVALLLTTTSGCTRIATAVRSFVRGFTDKASGLEGSLASVGAEAIGSGRELALPLCAAFATSSIPPAYCNLQVEIPIRQYAATRHLARSVYARLGVESQPLLNRKDCSPIWPARYLGALTHTEVWCGVAVTSETEVGGVGIDAERNQALDTGVAKHVLTDAEWIQLEREGHDPLQIAALWFSAKESVYKAVFPTVQCFIGFAEGLWITSAVVAHAGRTLSAPRQGPEAWASTWHVGPAQLLSSEKD